MNAEISASKVGERQKRHFLNLYAMALADLSIDPLELKLLFHFGEKRGISRTELEKLLLNPHLGAISIPATTLERVENLYEFAQMIWADGRVDPSERALLERFCKLFGFTEENVMDIADFLLGQARENTSMSAVLTLVENSMEN